MGGIQALGGLAEASAGILFGVSTAETGLGALAGAAAFTSGVDNYQTGMKAAFFGREQMTTFRDSVAPVIGISDLSARAIEMGLGVATSIPLISSSKSVMSLSNFKNLNAVKDSQRLGFLSKTALDDLAPIKRTPH